MYRHVILGLIVLGMMVSVAAPICAADRDGDGISDEQESQLGTDPDRADVLQVVIDDGVNRRSVGQDPTTTERKTSLPWSTVTWRRIAICGDGPLPSRHGRKIRYSTFTSMRMPTLRRGARFRKALRTTGRTTW